MRKNLYTIDNFKGFLFRHRIHSRYFQLYSRDHRDDFAEFFERNFNDNLGMDLIASAFSWGEEYDLWHRIEGAWQREVIEFTNKRRVQ